MMTRMPTPARPQHTHTHTNKYARAKDKHTRYLQSLSFFTGNKSGKREYSNRYQPYKVEMREKMEEKTQTERGRGRERERLHTF